jgi:hypothetical protein
MGMLSSRNSHIIGSLPGSSRKVLPGVEAELVGIIVAEVES